MALLLFTGGFFTARSLTPRLQHFDTTTVAVYDSISRSVGHEGIEVRTPPPGLPSLPLSANNQPLQIDSAAVVAAFYTPHPFTAYLRNKEVEINFRSSIWQNQLMEGTPQIEYKLLAPTATSTTYTPAPPDKKQRFALYLGGYTHYTPQSQLQLGPSVEIAIGKNLWGARMDFLDLIEKKPNFQISYQRSLFRF